MNQITIWIDADACPRVIKDILYKAANRTKSQMVLVANTRIIHPPSLYIRSVLVEKGFDSADGYIVNQLSGGDFVITADIPLAYEVIQKKGHALNPRGELYTENNIKQILDFRNINEQIRASGERQGGPPPLNEKDKRNFANALDQWLAKHKKI